VATEKKKTVREIIQCNKSQWSSLSRAIWPCNDFCKWPEWKQCCAVQINDRIVLVGQWNTK